MSEVGQGAMYGVIDPDYAKVFTIARCIAWQEGYAAVLHGSFTRDLDILLVPWAEHARTDLGIVVRRISEAAELREVGSVSDKLHGRKAYTFRFDTFGDPRFIDLSGFAAASKE